MTENWPPVERRGRDLISKVPQVTLAFWVIKILATTLGETGGDAVTMTLQLGYAVGSLIFLGFFAVTLAAQVASKKYRPFVYWAVVVAGLIALWAAAHYFTKISASVLFWAAYILTRPLGATLGDTLTKPHEEGGFDLSRITASLVIAALMVVGVILTYRSSEEHVKPSELERDGLLKSH